MIYFDGAGRMPALPGLSMAILSGVILVIRSMSVALCFILLVLAIAFPILARDDSEGALAAVKTASRD